MSVMDFDVTKEKENTQPLRGGRNISQLGLALDAQFNSEHQRQLLQQREEFENLIKNNTGNDPLDNWYRYILWVEQSYPKHGHEGSLVPLLEHCLGKFENDNRYTDDRRFCKLWIKYIDLQQNPVELYHMMYAKGLCRGCADLYRAWAYYYEASGDFQSANNVFECGKRVLAQPYDELENAHKTLIMAAGQHMLYGPNEKALMEKRQALTTLHTYKPGRVGSVRIGNASTSNGPGVLAMPPSTSLSHKSNNNTPIAFYEDKGEEAKGVEIGPLSIVAAAKRQEAPKENTLKPRPWTSPFKKRHTVQKTAPPIFTVHVDGDDTKISGLQMPENYPKSTQETYRNWLVNLTISEPKDDKMIPMYPKSSVYSQSNTEFSLEELRARRYLNKKNPKEIPHQSPIINNKQASCVVDFPPISPEMSQIEQPKMFQQSFSDQSSKIFAKQKPDVTEAFKRSHSQLEEALQHPSPSIKLKQSPSLNLWTSDDKINNQSQVDNANVVKFDIWTSPDTCQNPKFSIYEQSNMILQERIEPKGSAMKTPIKVLNADDLAETGSRGGMDIGAAAQPIDSAKRLPTFDEDSNSSAEEIRENTAAFSDLTCNTQMFNFNLNVMQVSTPQAKQEPIVIFNDEESTMVVRKQLFSENGNNGENQNLEKPEKCLSPIMEETKSYRSSSSSSGAMTKSSLFSNHTKQTNMAAISEEHNSYLAQNLMANAALRSSLLGDIMDFETPQKPSPMKATAMQNNSISNKTINYRPTIPPTPLDFVPSDPFKPAVINELLQKVSFPNSCTRGYYLVNNIPKLSVRKEAMTIGSDRYVIEKRLGKGTFGTVFRSLDLKSNNTVALKYQKPPNKWEFYICRELQNRLADHPLRDRFMDVRIGYFSDQASLLVSEFMPCGSLLDVANAVKQKSGRAMKESLCMYFCLDMLKVVKAMHDVNIIHADIKPDNFLVQVAPDGNVGLQLIDFGCSIDMTLFPPGAGFTRRVTTEDFVCCEMKDGRPWNYHTDLYCIAATAHVLLFEQYIRLKKKDGLWSISHHLPRYLRLDLWNMFFSSLLNQQTGPADSFALQAMFEESLKHRMDDFYIDMRYLTNILKNR